MKENKEKKTGKRILPFLFGGGLGAVMGFVAAYVSDVYLTGIIGICVMVIALILSFVVHILLHEGGHLVFGLLSGYQFVSFRILDIIWVKQGEKIVRRKFAIPGTAGQCLLDPPEPDKSGAYPSVLYNLGGGLSNLFWSGLALLLLLLAEQVMIKISLIAFACIGVYLGITNLLPLKIGGIANDGHNIREFRRNRESAQALWLQMRVNKLQQTDGLRLCEMPEAYFAVGEENALGEPLMDAIRVMKFQRLLDEQHFEEAEDYGKKLKASKELLSVYRNIVCVELLYLELIGSCRKEEIEALYNKELKKYLKMVKDYPSTHRVLYAYADRFAKDEAMAGKERKAFEKALATYPTPGEIRTEKILMEVI